MVYILIIIKRFILSAFLYYLSLQFLFISISILICLHNHYFHHSHTTIFPLSLPILSPFIFYRTLQTMIRMWKTAIMLSLMVTVMLQDYTLELDWALSSSPSSSQVGYVTWNDQTLLVLTHAPGTGPWRREKIPLVFDQGLNQLGIYFLGLSGTIVLDNIAIRKGSSSINYVLNGDFQMCQLAPGEQLRVFSGKIPGWNAPQITIGAVVGGGRQLVLTTGSRSVTQTISFGKVSNYQFIDSINAAIQNQAKNIINSKLQTIAPNNNPIWNTSFLQSRATVPPVPPAPNVPTPTINGNSQPPSAPTTTNAQSITATVSQLLQFVGNAPTSLLGL